MFSFIRWRSLLSHHSDILFKIKLRKIFKTSVKKNLTFSFIYLLAKSIAQSKYSPLQSTKLICTWHNTMSSKHLLRGIVGTPISGVFIVKHLVQIQHIISIIRLVLITSTSTFLGMTASVFFLLLCFYQLKSFERVSFRKIHEPCMCQ